MQQTVCELLLGTTVEAAKESCFAFALSLGKPSKEGRKIEVELERWGKRRPTFLPDIDNAFRGLSKQQMKALSRSAEVTYPPVSPDPSMPFKAWRDAAGDAAAAKLEAQKWQSLETLDLDDINLMTAYFRLLASLCAGQNYPKNEDLVGPSCFLVSSGNFEITCATHHIQA